MAVIYLRNPEGGCKVATMELEAVYDEGRGWVRFDPTKDLLDHDGDGKKGGSLSGGTDDEAQALRKQYTARFGKKPYMGWNAEILTEKLKA